MLVLSVVAELRSVVRDWRSRGEQIAFVPTMGNLHAGHLHLVERAHQIADRVVVSIFVNPAQFSPGEDYHSYPRTPVDDARKLAEARVDALFLPTVGEMYPGGVEGSTRVEVPALASLLCGAFRPGHFSGVTTVVAKLFNMVQPDIALFGEKDYQQLLLVQRMAADLGMPVQIVGVPTVREPDGLAMSSRNSYLMPEERERAPILYRLLREAASRIEAGERDYGVIEHEGMQALRAASFWTDYFSVRSAHDLAAPHHGDTDLVVLVAAWLGKARLIDNVQVTLDG